MKIVLKIPFSRVERGEARERKHAELDVLRIYFDFCLDFLIFPTGDKLNSFSLLTVSRRNEREVLLAMQTNMSIYHQHRGTLP